LTCNDAPREITISVRELAEWAYPEGDLESAFQRRGKAQKAVHAHKKLQADRPAAYQREVVVETRVEERDFSLLLRGRIDGVLREDGRTVVEEIKTTYEALEHMTPHRSHVAQAKLYAHIYGSKKKLEPIEIHLTYYNLGTGEIRQFPLSGNRRDLNRFFLGTVSSYLNALREQDRRREVRNASIRNLTFPYPAYRQGQESFADEVSQGIIEGNKLFARAPTGIGKTAAVLYPAVKSMADGMCDRIFYLTARTTTRHIAEATLRRMRENGAKVKSVTLTAKAKICFLEEEICVPGKCPFAKDYYVRVGDALRESARQEELDRQGIEKYAAKHRVCPFEFSLDAALGADCIICDYNYLFDPRVFLRRFFVSPKERFIFLIDEAHNLVDRTRQMYSASLEKRDFLSLLRRVDQESSPELFAGLDGINASLLAIRKEMMANHFVQEVAPEFLAELLYQVREQVEEVLALPEAIGTRDELLSLYFDVVHYLRIYELYDSHFATLFEKSGSNIRVKLLCLDTSSFIREKTDLGRSTVFFSATLLPEDFYRRLLGGGADDPFIQVPSPFPRRNLCLVLDDTVSTKLPDRPASISKIVGHIDAATRKEGNYLLFFPSYAYMEDVHREFLKICGSLRVVKQERDMSESQREEFLSRFSPQTDSTLVAFAVMGGIFGESIDLAGDRLTGVIVVGVGHPAIGVERNLILEYFESELGEGYSFAYVFPGFNRVAQAMGRLIRTEADRGVALLIDSRFSNSLYSRLFPPEWRGALRVTRPAELLELVTEFWRNEVLKA
jgi:Rad3-related DNA helicase